MTDLSYVHVLFRGHDWFPVGPQQEADDLLPERTSAAARKAGLLLGHVSPASSCSSHFPRFFLSSFGPPGSVPLMEHVWPCLCRSGLVSSQPPALCPTSSASSTSGPSLSATLRLSSSAPSTTLLRSNPAIRSSCPGEPRSYRVSFASRWFKSARIV